MAKDAIATWVAEKQWYNYDNNNCSSGYVCGHYTQVVWKQTKMAGCSKIICDSGNSFITCEHGRTHDMSSSSSKFRTMGKQVDLRQMLFKNLKSQYNSCSSPTQSETPHNHYMQNESISIEPIDMDEPIDVNDVDEPIDVNDVDDQLM
ncbi:cysteine-rich venom protein-like [Chenopodium quinoa]|uniref:cysteine-rich venom protein-like n=1 Tax=Chenopodium quinoa TaxID=63459 RepID=UPI000B786E16|nr:cysteine-rich venom protein-like [Chenopodium quinoa]